jgi:TonB family protein
MKKTIIHTLTATVAGVIMFAGGNDFEARAANHGYAEYTSDDDTTVYNEPDQTAMLPDAVNYFRQNNKFKDWNANDRKNVVLQGIVEKDGTITNVKILRSSKVKELDDEALRLIKSAKYAPGEMERKAVRSKFTIGVPFPAG